jgi:GNAT superfamily N-acetyltransferase
VEDGPDGLGGVLDACFVEEEARELGLGHLLLKSSLEWFASQGCSGVDGIAHPGDREAKQFFEGAGFTARLLVMHRSLE